MSFGWSAGDIFAAIKLVNQITSCIGDIGGAREHFQELVAELQGLEDALTEIAKLASLSDHTVYQRLQRSNLLLATVKILCSGSTTRFGLSKTA
jgi:hypothetical protein